MPCKQKWLIAVLAMTCFLNRNAVGMRPSQNSGNGIQLECSWNATLAGFGKWNAVVEMHLECNPLVFSGGRLAGMHLECNPLVFSGRGGCRNALGMQPFRVFWGGGACRNALGMQPSRVFGGLAGMHWECNPLVFSGGGLAGMHLECNPLVFSGGGLAGMHLECNPLVFSGRGGCRNAFGMQPFRVFWGGGLAGMHLECNPLVFSGGGGCRNALGMQPSRVFWGRACRNALGTQLDWNPFSLLFGGCIGMELACSWTTLDVYSGA